MSTEEIERRFLLSALPEDWQARAQVSRIEQGYLLIEDDARELRIRRRDGDCSMTVKSGQGLCRREQEQPISQALFEMLWPLSGNRSLVKRRYTLEREGRLFEIDVYEGDLAPLCILEVEFPDLKAAQAFVPPRQVLRELTEDPRYRNAALATATPAQRRSIVEALISSGY